MIVGLIGAKVSLGLGMSSLEIVDGTYAISLNFYVIRVVVSHRWSSNIVTPSLLQYFVACYGTSRKRIWGYIPCIDLQIDNHVKGLLNNCQNLEALLLGLVLLD